MLSFLEERIEGCYKAGNPAWSALLGSWMVAAEVLRYKHISRAVPERFRCQRSMDTAQNFFWLGAAWVKSRAERPSVSGVN